MKEICFVTGWYSAPYFSSISDYLGEEIRSSFIVHDSYSHQYLLQQGHLNVYKRRQRSFKFSLKKNYYNEFIKMDIHFTKQGFGNYNFWEKYYNKRSEVFEKWLKLLWSKNYPDIIIIWNGMWYFEKLVVKYAREKNIKILFLENGYFPNTIHIDPIGVNCNAEIVYQSDNKNSPNNSDKDLINFVQKIKNSFLELKPYSQVSDLVNTLSPIRKIFVLFEILIMDLLFIAPEFFAKLIILLKSKRNRVLLQTTQPLPKRYIFIPLQKTYDSQIILNSPWVHSPRELIFIVLDAIKSLGLNYDLVVKEHPMEDAHISFKDIQQRYPSIYWASKNSLQDLILNSSLIININSSVGFHALLFGKPVICLGKSLYTGDGLADYCSKKDDLLGIIKNALIKKISEEKVNIFAKTLFEKYSFPYTRGAIKKREIEIVANFLKDNF